MNKTGPKIVACTRGRMRHLSPRFFLRVGWGGGGRASVHSLLKERWISSLSFCCLSFFSTYSYLESWRTWTHFSWPLRGWTTETGSVLWRNALWGLFWESYRLFDWLLRVSNGRLGQKCPENSPTVQFETKPTQSTAQPFKMANVQGNYYRFPKPCSVWQL